MAEPFSLRIYFINCPEMMELGNLKFFVVSFFCFFIKRPWKVSDVSRLFVFFWKNKAPWNLVNFPFFVVFVLFFRCFLRFLFEEKRSFLFQNGVLAILKDYLQLPTHKLQERLWWRNDRNDLWNAIWWKVVQLLWTEGTWSIIPVSK